MVKEGLENFVIKEVPFDCLFLFCISSYTWCHSSLHLVLKFQACVIRVIDWLL